MSIIKTGILYRADSGKIEVITEGYDKELDISLPMMMEDEFSELRIPHSEEISFDTHYVKDSAVKAYPEKTRETDEWDLVNEVWVNSVENDKQQKWESIKITRNDKEFGGFEFQGKIYDSDKISQQRIQGASQLAMLDNTITMDWTTKDNSFVNLTAPELIQLGVAMATHINTQHGIARQLRAQLDAATTVQEVEAISWPLS